MKIRNVIQLSAVTLALFLFIGLDHSYARMEYDIDYYANQYPAGRVTATNDPYVDFGVHDIGKIGMTVTNQGHIGTGFITAAGNAPSCQYPYPSQQDYLFAGAFWIGAVVGRDTLVSVAADGWYFTREMWPDPGEFPPPAGGAMIERSISNANDLEAISEQDFVAVYTDTVTDPAWVGADARDGRPHIPLNVEVTQRTYAWSYSYAEDFILFDYSIKNIGRKTLEKVYMGIYVDADVRRPNQNTGFDDDICGFKPTIPSPQGCNFIDTVNIAYIADNNGKDDDGTAATEGCDFPSVTGVRVVRTPSDSLKYSFNWWISNGNAALDWGPRRLGTPDDPYRDFGGFLGTPEGDKNKYYIMRHEEFDYDQLFAAIDHTADGWFPRDPTQAFNFADGYDTRYLFSFGPFEIDPGEVLPISFCYVAGEDFHTEPCDAFEDMPFNANDPQPYYDTLDFDDFGLNAVWASWIYDNPGVDTDGDGYAGKFRVCAYDSMLAYDTVQLDPLIVDTFWMPTLADTFNYEGDGVPDFRGASPPPPPELWIVTPDGDTLGNKIEPRVVNHNSGELRIRWNGFYSETTRDVFSGKLDFEGYRVWVSYSPDASSYSVVASYDIEDYNRLIWNKVREEWQLLETPFTLDSLKAIYGEDFNPDDYPLDNPLVVGFPPSDTAFYFISQDWNQADLTDTLGIHKVYPNEPKPPDTLLNIDSARVYLPEVLTPDGLFFKYYEYEFVLRNLLPSQLQYIAVTAFDYGSPVSGLPSLETPPNKNFIAEYAQNKAGLVEQQGLDVIVYPNPYRVDGNYAGQGFEARDYVVYNSYTDSLISQVNFNEDRTRSIHFINLPHKCTIRIYTIDGDLVREIQHDAPEGAPQSSHERWDLITRNTQAVVSGIYYYSVESEFGSQIGKLVIIM